MDKLFEFMTEHYNNVYFAIGSCICNQLAFIFVSLHQLKTKVATTLVFRLFKINCIIYSIIDFFLIASYYEKRIQYYLCSLWNLLFFNFNQSTDNPFLIKMNLTSYSTLFMLSIFIELVYSIESILLLINPFSKFSTRWKIYVLLSIALILFNFSFFIGLDNSDIVLTFSIFKQCSFLNKMRYICATLAIIYFAISIYIIILLARTLKTTSLTIKKTKKKFSIVLLIIILITDCAYICPLIQILYHQVATRKDDTAFRIIIFLFTVQGALVSIIRSLELLDVYSYCLKVKKKMISTNLEINLREMDKSNENRESILTIDQYNDNQKSESNSSHIQMIVSNQISDCFRYLLKTIIAIGEKISEETIGGLAKDIDYNQVIYHKCVCKGSKVTIQSGNHEPFSMLKLLFSWSEKAKIIEYAPTIFRKIMLNSNITKEQINHSFNRKKNESSFREINESEGKSGSLFFITHDFKFFIKSVSDGEFDVLTKKFLPSYNEKIRDENNISMSKVYGAYKFRLGLTEINFILMENIAPYPLNIFTVRYDLKGSEKGRRGLPGQAKKDLNFLDEKTKIQLEPDGVIKLLKTLENDVKILEEANLMDYSLFIGVRKNDTNSTTILSDKEYYSYDRKLIYCIGIIDFLTEYKSMKTLEHAYLSIFNKSNLISAVEPKLYGTRFFNFMRIQVFQTYRNYYY